MAAGADVCVVSVHKMGTGLEPGSVFHQQDGLVDPDQLSACADMLMTASPNVMIYAALDGWRRQMAEHGQDLLDAADWRRERQRLGMGLSDHRRIEATLSIELPDYLRSGPSPDAIRVVSPH